MAGAIAFYFTLQGSVAWPILFAPLALFIVLVALQSKIDRRAALVRRAIRFYTDAIARLNNQWRTIGQRGDEFVDPHHPYSADLDIFGHGSVFQLLSTARTRGGEAQLAHWLKTADSPERITARQQAVEELRPLLDWREELAVLGEDYRTSADPESLLSWAAAPPAPFSKLVRILALALSIAALGAIVWWFSTNFVGLASRLTLIGIGLVEALFVLRVRNRVSATVQAIDEPAADLGLLAGILGSIELRSFNSPLLREIRSKLDITGEPASTRLARLRRWKELLDSRDNAAVRVFGPLLLWTTQVTMAIEQWRTDNRDGVPRWLEAVAELEALSSLAAYAYENPEDSFPVFTKHAPHFAARDLTHPLLPQDRAVRNSVELGADRRLYLVSGSNMSGKSTLLRSVGVNAVLAMAGAPVRARSLTLSPLTLGASIRTMDSLEEGRSRFMAEIVRLKQILDLPSPALFLLDELLHGTNSHDRAIGSEGVIRALLARGDIGMVTTHDLSLAKIVDEFAHAAVNVHFEDKLEGAALVFDYEMKPGVVARSNALDLMRATGLKV